MDNIGNVSNLLFILCILLCDILLLEPLWWCKGSVLASSVVDRGFEPRSG